MDQYGLLVAKLREILQIDRPELDFGIYRIMAARRAEIDAYLRTRLKARVDEALNKGAQAGADALRLELAKAEGQARELGIDPDGNQKVRTLRKQLSDANAGTTGDANAVFSHLLTFFSRYYDGGDFISQRRYKGDTYAIPYAGEEVVLHWANKDQYYVKSGESFQTYAFRLDDGRRVVFRLAAADTAKDNRKDEGARLFALAGPRDGVVPVAEEDGELLVRFDYRAFPKSTKQDTLNEAAAAAVLGSPAAARWPGLAAPAPTEGNPARTLLGKHLTAYTAKASTDYFIHKDLGGFLRRELDHYVKTEVMNLDDVASAGDFAPVEAKLRMIVTLRAIARDLIAFLAAFEDFQKRLWLKRKFVVSADYVVTLDRVPAALWPAVIANARQWAAWEALGMWAGATPGTEADLSANLAWMVDTALFDVAFKADLLRALPGLDASLDGVCIQGDNFQALTLLEERYRGGVNCVYIDPPYNTDGSPIAYKNGFKKSSWNSLMENRLSATKALMRRDALLCVLIDDFQKEDLTFVMSGVFGDDGVIGTVAIRSNPSGRPVPSGFAQAHEYATYARVSEDGTIGTLPRSAPQLARYREEDADGRYMWELFRKRGSASLRTDRPSMFYPLYAGENSLRIPTMTWDNDEKVWINMEPPAAKEKVLWPLDDDGNERRWRWSVARTSKDLSQIKVCFNIHGYTVYYKYRPENDTVLPLTVWTDARYSATEHGTDTLKRLFKTANVFDFPKSLFAVADCMLIGGAQLQHSLTLDYFAGSGTTAHAAILLNRADGGARRYILVEQGPYFDTVLTPRIQKVVFSADWRDGKPVAPDTGISHAFKRLRIEGYEDTLNNLAPVRPAGTDTLLARMDPVAADDYRMRYALDVETRGALLGLGRFQHPFAVQLDIAASSAAARAPVVVDLVETFNLLIGLTVDRMDLHPLEGWAAVTGTLPSGGTALVLWRDCAMVNDAALRVLAGQLDAVPGCCGFDCVYINGDHTLPATLTEGEGEDATTHRVRYEAIEPAFLSAMFDVADA